MADFTQYQYHVDVRIDSDNGTLAVSIFGANQSGEVGTVAENWTDSDIASRVGKLILTDARIQEHGNPLSVPVHDHREPWGNLHDLYMGWLKGENLGRGSTEELLCRDNLTEYQRDWLHKFEALWTLMEDNPGTQPEPTAVTNG